MSAKLQEQHTELKKSTDVERWGRFLELLQTMCQSLEGVQEWVALETEVSKQTIKLKRAAAVKKMMEVCDTKLDFAESSTGHQKLVTEAWQAFAQHFDDKCEDSTRKKLVQLASTCVLKTEVALISSSCSMELMGSWCDMLQSLVEAMYQKNVECNLKT
eukprot:6488113-Amphidinium_carterae.1